MTKTKYLIVRYGLLVFGMLLFLAGIISIKIGRSWVVPFIAFWVAGILLTLSEAVRAVYEQYFKNNK